MLAVVRWNRVLTDSEPLLEGRSGCCDALGRNRVLIGAGFASIVEATSIN